MFLTENPFYQTISILVSLHIYSGLFFVSRYVFDKYCPSITIEKSCIPLKNDITLIVEGHHSTGSPKSRVRIMIIIVNITAKMEKKIPVIVETLSMIVLRSFIKLLIMDNTVIISFRILSINKKNE